MRIKKFTAPTMKEAIAQMKKELGDDAVVLKSEKINKGGIFDFFGKELIEITAAKDEPKAKSPYPSRNLYSSRINFNTNTEGIKKELNDLSISMLKEEIKEIKNEMSRMSDLLKYRDMPNLPENLILVLKQLLENEVEERIAKKLIEGIHYQLKGDDYNNLKLILDLLLKKISSLIKVVPENNLPRSEPKTIALIGPTGVGKTTTIAKLATKNKLINRKKVGLISIDTFRIAAVEQLKTFANIAEIPLKVVYTPDEMINAVSEMKDMELIYIDTTGRSQKDTPRLKEIKKFLEMIHPDEVHLVISMTSKLKDIMDVVEKFGIITYNRLLFTKLDETTNLGAALSVITRIKKPLSYLSTGQNVPDDIEKVNPDKLARMMVRREFL
ncbi:flagellar biosynthesis protein FlhF [candidate division KSB1 bacterium]|nr:MAG: flagellar biosynthesis protein FlhF [candidate division KSB1 bacterium]